jgi:hypothetical protein
MSPNYWHALLCDGSGSIVGVNTTTNPLFSFAAYTNRAGKPPDRSPLFVVLKGTLGVLGYVYVFISSSQCTPYDHIFSNHFPFSLYVPKAAYRDLHQKTPCESSSGHLDAKLCCDLNQRKKLIEVPLRRA